MEIARQEATVKMYTFRMNSEPENYAALTEEYKAAEEKLAKLYERWDAIAEDMYKGGLHERYGTGGSQGND